MKRESGNGQVFEKRQYIPLLTTHIGEETREARALSAIEILGSAQDRDFTAQLDFVFRIPDPSARPFIPALEIIAATKRDWSQGNLRPKESAIEIEQDLSKIATALGKSVPNLEPTTPSQTQIPE